MKKTALFLLLSLACFAETNPFYSYGNVHMMGGYPMVGVGLRSRQAAHGIDVSGSIFPYFTGISNFMFHAKGLYLYRPGGKSVYIGAGLGLLSQPEVMRQVSGSWEGSFGFEWRTKRGSLFFLEADGIAPFRKATVRVHKGNKEELREKRHVWPGVTFGFGF